MDVKGAKALSERLAEAALNVDPESTAFDPRSDGESPPATTCRGIDLLGSSDARRAASTVALRDQQPVNTHFAEGAAETDLSA